MRKNRKKNPLKLFYWPSVKALACYSHGHAFALATSKAAAIKLIVSHRTHDQFGRESGQPEIDEDALIHLSELARELEEKAPQIFARSKGFAMRGSE